MVDLISVIGGYDADAMRIIRMQPETRDALRSQTGTARNFDGGGEDGTWNEEMKKRTDLV